MESRRFRGGDLDGLVALAPGLSGLPFWIWCWSGGVLDEAEPLVLVTRGPSLPDPPAGRVAVHPEVVVIDGPPIEADEGFPRLAAWLGANRGAICGHWYQVGPVRADDLLAAIRPAPGPTR